MKNGACSLTEDCQEYIADEEGYFAYDDYWEHRRVDHILELSVHKDDVTDPSCKGSYEQISHQSYERPNH